MKYRLSDTQELPEICRTGLVGLFLNLFGIGYPCATLTPEGVTIRSRPPVRLDFEDIAAEVQVSRRLGISSLTIRRHCGATVEVVGVSASSAVNFAGRANEAWKGYYKSIFAATEHEISELSEAVRRLESPRRYPSACLLQPFVERARSLAARLPESIPEQLVDKTQHEELDRVKQLARFPSQLREEATRMFVDTELREMAQFFDDIETNPLTTEQRLAVVTDEDATLVLAGAGSGKTSVITAKAAYLIERQIRHPDEILLMAFGKDAAEEMAKRIKKRCGSPVDALTFHALAYGIIREVEGQAPALAPHASDEAHFRNLLRDILLKEIAKLPDYGDILRHWFGELYLPYKNQWDFKSKDEYYQYVEAHELRSLKGERVRSFEELQIANWLFLNSIAYEYEPDYEHDLPENNRRAYTPDFRLTESGVYIEHFGVRKMAGPDGKEQLTTAPMVDRDEYLEGMEWKRRVHADNGTALIETFSHERVEERLTEALAEKIAPYATPRPIPAELMFETLSELGHLDGFTQTLATFLRHYKSASLTIEACRAKGRSSEEVARSMAFLYIFEPVFEAYQRRLDTRIDFEDMILRATDLVRSGRYKSPYRHLLVDEFQDISDGRAKLLLALKEQHDNIRIFAVGDDWQSIFRFTGSDIHQMRNFGKEFGGSLSGETGIHKTVDLGRTFRSVDKIALPARSFVLRNPSQINKKVIPAGETDAPAIMIAYHSRDQDADTLGTALRHIEGSCNGEKETTVLLLGRYRFVCPTNLDALRKSHPKLNIRFVTVHGSKGLEADHVIVLQASSGRMGFPSEIVDDPLLDLVLPEAENFDHAEERRLFYVALTRARYTATVFADRERPSTFVRELEKVKEYGAVVIEEAGVAKYACGKCGGRMLAKTSKTGSTYFACDHGFLCGETLLPCSSCGNDLPIADEDDRGKMKCSCGAEYIACPSCTDGWLVERSSRYGTFLGCIKYPECRGKKKSGSVEIQD